MSRMSMSSTRAPFPTKPTHSQHLERFLGKGQTESVSKAMEKWYGPPIALAGVPGEVYVCAGGDFIGRIRAGSDASARDRFQDILTRERKRSQAAMARGSRQLGAFSNISQIIAAVTGGKGQYPIFSKTGVAANAIGNSNDLWTRAGLPSAGAAAASAPGGTVPTQGSTGALRFANPTNANTLHFLNASISASAVNTLLLYDRIFSVAKTMNSTATEAVTGVPTRYQSSTATNGDYAGGNFCFPANPTTVLAATAHNWNVCQFTDAGGGTGNNFPSIAGVSACVVGGVDLAVGNWFMPLAATTAGVKALTQMQCSAAVATGTIDFVLGHPIAFCPCPIANIVSIIDGLYSAINLQSIYDNACLSMMEITKPATTATNYNGQFTFVSE
jgi:hypothetical protein